MASLFGPLDKEALIAGRRALRRDRRDGYDRWTLLIKALRLRHDAGILEAERIALSNRHRRRWVEKQIDRHPICRQHAWAHIRIHGEAALIERDGATDIFRIR